MFGDKLSQGIATGTAGTLMGSSVVTAVPANTGVVVPLGDYYLRAVGADCRLQILDETGVWQNVLAVGIGGLISSDGANVRVFNTLGAGGASENFTTQKIA